MTGPSRLGCLHAFLLSFALGVSNAHAVYQYEYTGTTFDVIYEIGGVGSEVWPTRVSAEVFSPTLLTAGSNLTTSGLSFALSLNTALFGGGFASPLPYPAPSFEPGTFIYDVTFNIGAVSAAGLPTAWNISIVYQNFNFPFGERAIATSSERDLVMHAVLRPFEINYDATLVGNPGTWKVSVVPEPESYVMLLAGLGLVGWMARRRRGVKVERE